MRFFSLWKLFSSYTHQKNNLILEWEADAGNVHNYDACQVMCCLVDRHISQLAETRTVRNARWGLLSALLRRCIRSSGGSTTRHSSDGCISASPVWSFSLGQNKHFHGTGWIEKKKTAFVSYVGNGDRRKWGQGSILPSAQLSWVTHCSQKPVPCYWPQESSVPLQGCFSLSQPASAFPID